MRVHAIGLGGAGGRIVDRLAADHDDDRFLHGVTAFDTDAGSLDALRSLDATRRYRFGDGAGGGLDGDLHAGRQLGEAHASELDRAMDDENPSVAEAFVLVVGLGGATGAGAAPALATELDRIHGVPVYAVGVLPSRTERQSTSGSGSSRPVLAERNAARTLSTLSTVVDAVFPFDNGAWLRTDETLADGRDRINGVIVERMATLFGAGESAADVPTPQQVLDASDVARAVGDEGELAALGYATQPVEPPARESRFGLGLFDSSAPPEVDASAAVSAVETVIRKATRGKGTVEVPGGRADRTLLVVGGHPAWLNREAIAAGRRWLADETGSGAILSGDAPVPDGDSVFALIVRSGIDEPKRIRELRESIE